jgi:hypothetical protein
MKAKNVELGMEVILKNLPEPVVHFNGYQARVSMVSPLSPSEWIVQVLGCTAGTRLFVQPQQMRRVKNES